MWYIVYNLSIDKVVAITQDWVYCKTALFNVPYLYVYVWDDAEKPEPDTALAFVKERVAE